MRVAVPLLERLKFLCISSSNLDEFFEIRVAGIKQLVELGAAAAAQPGRHGPGEAAGRDPRARRALVAEQYAVPQRSAAAGAARAGRRPHRAAERVDASRQRAWLLRHFDREVEPVLSRSALDPARPFPRIQNKSLNFIVRLEGKDAFGREADLAIVQAPRSLPRVVPLPTPGRTQRFVLLSAIVQEFVPRCSRA
jgi:polyphosphate kinase